MPSLSMELTHGQACNNFPVACSWYGVQPWQRSKSNLPQDSHRQSSRSAEGDKDRQHMANLLGSILRRERFRGSSNIIVP